MELAPVLSSPAASAETGRMPLYGWYCDNPENLSGATVRLKCQKYPAGGEGTHFRIKLTCDTGPTNTTVYGPYANSGSYSTATCPGGSVPVAVTRTIR